MTAKQFVLSEYPKARAIKYGVVFEMWAIEINQNQRFPLTLADAEETENKAWRSAKNWILEHEDKKEAQ